MKKHVTAFTALLCALVMIPALVLSTVFGGTFAAPDTLAAASEDAALLSATTETSSVGIPAPDEPLPDGITIWDGHYATGFSGGTGKSSDPYLISTPDELAFLIDACVNSVADNVNNKGTQYAYLSYRITADLAFNPDFDYTGATVDATGLREVPLSLPDTVFNGVIDGGNHRIYNLYAVYRGENVQTATGLFGVLKGTVKDLHLVRGYMHGNNTNNQMPGGGTFARCLRGTLSGCSSSVTYVFDNNVCGGLVGLLQNSGRVTSGEYRGRIYAKNDATGGIIGLFDTMTNICTVTDCINRGTITSAGKFTGGILGKARGDWQISLAGLDIRRCINYGDITSTYVGDSSANVGGLLGGLEYLGDGTRQLDHCASFGTVTAQDSNVGGLVGYIGSDDKAGNKLFYLNACYNMGDVIGTENVGGMVGLARCPVQVTEGIAGGSVSADTSAGGFVGGVNANYYSGGPSALKLYACHQIGQVTAVTAAGGAVGTLYCGTPTTSGLFLGGTFMDGVITAGAQVGGLAGNYAAGNYGTKAVIQLEYSVICPRIYVKQSNAVSALLVGGNGNGTTSCTLTQTQLFVGNNMYDASGEGDPVKIARPYVARGCSDSLANDFVEEDLTNGKYLNILNLYASKNSYSKWVSAASGTPAQTTPDRIASQPLTRRYDGMPSTVNDSAWSGTQVNCQWYEWRDGAWVRLWQAPQNVGTYRVGVALLSERAAGAAVVEFEIQKQLLDCTTLSWQTDTARSYTGQEQVMELLGIPEEVTVVYSGNRYTAVGSYTARLVSAEDTSGNYEVVGVPEVAPQPWRINTATLDMSGMTWSHIGEGETTPRLTYNEQAQSVVLIDPARPDLDMGALLTIVYDGNTETDVGSYRAEARVTYDPANVVVENPKVVFTTYWSIEKRVIHPADYLTFEGETELSDGGLGVCLPYDAAAHKLSYTSVLPACVGVSISSDAIPSHTAAGSYDCRLSFTLTDTANNVLAEDSLTRTLVIERVAPKILGAKGFDTTYNGKAQEVGIEYDENEEPQFVITVGISGSAALQNELRDAGGRIYCEYYLGGLDGVKCPAAVNAGEYTVKVIYDAPETSNFADTFVTVPLIINRAVCPIQGNIILRDKSVLWDGTPKNIALNHEEELPPYVIPVYSAPQTDVGQYKVVVEFTFTPEMEGNYQPIPAQSAILTILTSALIDEGTDLQIRFPEGEPTFMRLLVKQRTDVADFNTNWSIGMDTSLKSLYQVELKQGLTLVSELENPVTVLLPLTGEMLEAEELYAVYVTIQDNGKYQVEELVSKIKEGDDGLLYLAFETTRIGYFGVVTSDPDSGRVVWIAVAACLALPAGIVIVLALRDRRRKKKQGR